MKKHKVMIGVLVLILFTLMATGCVFGPKNAKSDPIDPPQISYGDEEGKDAADIEFDLEESDDTAKKDGKKEDGKQAKDVNRTLYLFDKNGYVVPVSMNLPSTESVAKQALEYLVVDGPVTEMLPDGIRAVLPAGTELTVKVTDGTAVVDFSKEFKNYKAEDEKGILEAITWTLTQFDSIKDVVIWINGYPQEVMPVNKTPINKSLSRKDGINVEVAQGTNISNSSVVTLYFKAQSPNAAYEYFVPVTRIIPRNSDLLQATVMEMIAGPKIGSGLVSNLLPTTKIIEAKINKNIAMINFDKELLSYDKKGKKVAKDALTSIVLSLTETGMAEKVQFMVDGKKEIVSSEGKEISKPVSRPLQINSTGF